MRLIGLITARGGSKGIPGKNLVECAGLPLIAWTCNAATSARCLSAVYVSTDDARIAEQCAEFGVQSPFQRPDALAGDSAGSLEVLAHFIDWLEASGDYCDAVVLLQPTSPLRTAAHIDSAGAVFGAATWDSLVSVVRVEHRYMPEKLMRVVDGVAVPHVPGPVDATPRQRSEQLFARNGPAILISRAAVLRYGSLYGERIAAFEMSKPDSVDVDDMEDLAIAAALLRARGGGDASPPVGFVCAEPSVPVSRPWWKR